MGLAFRWLTFSPLANSLALSWNYFSNTLSHPTPSCLIGSHQELKPRLFPWVAPAISLNFPGSSLFHVGNPASLGAVLKSSLLAMS